MLLVVGLGNPGPKYADQRHNVGFMAIDELARWQDADPFRSKFASELSRLRLPDEEVLLLKPQTFMNRAGQAVQPAAAFFRIPAQDIVVIHDEVDLPLGTVRLKHGGGHAGHNGVRSVKAHLGTGDFGRIRIGVGRPREDFSGELADFVLASFARESAHDLPTILRYAAQSVLDIAAHGFAAAMKTRNTKPSKKRRPSSEEPSDGDVSADPEPAGGHSPAGGSTIS